MLTVEGAIEQVQSMRKRWVMYATTKEAYLAMLTTYLYVFVEDFSPNAFDRSLAPTRGPSTEWMQEPLTEEFAHKACDVALNILNAETAKPYVLPLDGSFSS